MPEMSSAVHCGGNLKLNYDILVLLFQSLHETDTVQHLMQTCRHLYSAGIPRLLSFPVILVSTQQWQTMPRAARRVLSFTNFILTDPRCRAGHIQHIEIFDYDGIPAELFDRLLQALRHASCLHTFKNVDCASVGEALAKNEGIKTLGAKLTGSVSSMVDALHKWRSPLETAHLIFPSSWISQELDLDSPYMDPAWILRPFVTTLQELTVYGGQIFRPGPGLVYPSMKKLKFEGNDWHLDGICDIARAYPNLTHLSMRDNQQEALSGNLEDIRRGNVGGNSDHHWGALAVVEGGIENIYALGLLCKVDHLRLCIDCDSDIVGSDFIPAAPAMLRTLLDAANPSLVSLQLALDETSDEVVYLEALTAAYETEGQCSICGTPFDTDALGRQPMPFIDTYVDILSTLGPLDCLRLDISIGVLLYFNAMRNNKTMLPGYMMEPAKISPRKSNIALALAVRIVRRVPALSKLELKFTSNSEHVWDILSDEQGGRKLRCVSSGDITQIPVHQ